MLCLTALPEPQSTLSWSSLHAPRPPLRRQCLEVACRNSNVKDGTGKTYERTGLCRNSGTVKVKITDT